MQRMYFNDLSTLLAKKGDYTNLFLERINQLSLCDFILEFSHNKKLFISLNSPAPFIAFSPDLTIFPKGGTLHSFAVDLRRFLSGRLEAINIVNNDTILALTFMKRNNVLDKENITLYLELIANHPQAVLVDSKNTILTAFRYTNEPYNSNRIVYRGATYHLPQFNPKKKNKENQVYDFYLSYLEENHERIKKQNYRDLYVYLEKNINKLQRLIQNYEHDLTQLDDIHAYYDHANLLLMEKPPIHSGTVVINDITISVDPRFTAVTNAELLFKKAKKLKKSEKILQEKITEVTTRLTYLRSILYQLNNTNNHDDIMAMFNELNLRHQKDRKPEISAIRPYVITYKNTNIIFGKNNHQNDFLTFNIAGKKDIFLHIKNAPGAHIIIQKETPEKDILEFAGRLALFLSKKIDGEISYTLRHNVKKGRYPGQVVISNEKTFYIREDETTKETIKKNIKRLL